ncbi:MFS transporter [Paenibacillus chitinolyticus]|uniref:MFS transporter n=1 Tax=Paenibacillus chitinolyticus TaxID=79263 RepID=A0A410WRE8_9BACL|nr:MFS transporter [Paenibacillus chitinolyticus]MCY9593895.1 MFS transporter [Paenibacillus chitinolyticus]MCY9598789.1 MFS transporter [Paenibacillus chitinolyticus]QAV16999.1 MFS transporter [Paenibacillus chitinolyticus]
MPEEKNNMSLPGFARKIIAATVFINMGRFSVFTFLAVYLTHTLQFPAWQSGTVLTVALLINQVVPLFSGMIGDRIGYSTMLVAGTFLAALGYLGIYALDSFGGLVLAACFIGIGPAMYEPSIKSLFGNLPHVLRRRAFTYFNQALNAGAVLGAVTGGILVSFHTSYPMLFGAGLFLLVSLLLLTQAKSFPKGRHSAKMLDSYKKVLRNRPFLAFSGAMAMFWIMFTQLSVSLPLEVYRMSGNERLVSSVVIFNGLYAVLFMFLLRGVFQRNPAAVIVKYGMLIIGLGLLAVPWVPSVLWVLLCVLVFTSGETLVLPGVDIAIAEYSMNEDTGAFYGAFGLSYAVGGTIGNYLGTWLSGEYGGTVWPWVIYGMIGLCGFICLQVLQALDDKTAKTVHTA